MKVDPMMFLLFAMLVVGLVEAIGLAITFGIDDYKKNKRIEYSPKKKGA